MLSSALIISFLVFSSILLFLTGAYSYYVFRQGRKKVVEKIKTQAQREPVAAGQRTIFSDGKGVKNRFLNLVSSIGARMKPKKKEEISSVRKRLLQAGYRKYNAPILFFGFKTFCAILFPAFLLLAKIIFIMTISSVSVMVIAIILALLGFYMPDLWLLMKTDIRKEKILEGFADALDLMVVCVEAGMGLDAAISRVGDEMKLRNKVLSEEFMLLSLELRAGIKRSDALRNLAMRTGLEDVNSLMTLLIQTDRFGTNVADALRVHSDSLRIKRQQKAEEIAAKLPVKLVFPLVLFIFPALFVVIVGPAIIKIIRVLLPALGG